MITPATFTICEVERTHLLIRDNCLDGHKSVTNDAEAVIAKLQQAGLLPNGRRLFYLDSDGELGEIALTDGQFAGFKPVTKASMLMLSTRTHPTT